jgi:hypothetical protein
MLAPVHQTIRPRASEDSIFIDTAMALYIYQAVYLPTVTSRCQLPVRMKLPVPSGVAPRLTEVVPVTQGDVDGDSHDLLLQNLKPELGFEVECCGLQPRPD